MSDLKALSTKTLEAVRNGIIEEITYLNKKLNNLDNIIKINTEQVEETEKTLKLVTEQAQKAVRELEFDKRQLELDFRDNALEKAKDIASENDYMLMHGLHYERIKSKADYTDEQIAEKVAEKVEAARLKMQADVDAAKNVLEQQYQLKNKELEVQNAMVHAKLEALAEVLETKDDNALNYKQYNSTLLEGIKELVSQVSPSVYNEYNNVEKS